MRSSFWISSNSWISRTNRRWMGVWVIESPELSGVGNQKFWFGDGLSEVLRSSLMYSSSVSILIAAVFSGFTSFASSGGMILNSATVVFFLIVYGVWAVFVTRMSSLWFTTVDMKLATTNVFPLQWLMAGLTTPVVSTFDDTSVWTEIVCVVSGGMVMGVLVWTLYSFRFLVF